MSHMLASTVGMQLMAPGGHPAIGRAACTFFGVALPIYASYRALENRRSLIANALHEDEGRRDWLRYWTVYGTLHAAETQLGAVTALIPAYQQIKLCFLLYLQIEPYKGASWLYEQYLSPFFSRHQEDLDSLVLATYGRIEGLVSRHQDDIAIVWARLAEGVKRAFGGGA